MKQGFFRSIRLFRLNSVIVKTFLTLTGLFLGIILLINILVAQILSESYMVRETLTNLHTLSQASQAMDTIMVYLANDMYVAMWNKDVRSMMVSPNHRTHERDYAITDFLNRTQTMNSFVDEISLYLPNVGLVYSATGIKTCTSGTASGIPVIDAYQFNIKDFQVFHTTDRTRSSLYCVDGTLYIAQEFFMNRILGVLIFVINQEGIYEVIQGNRQFAQGDILIYDRNGKTVFNKVKEYEYAELVDLRNTATLITNESEEFSKNNYYAVESSLLGWSFLYPAAKLGIIDNLPGILSAVVPVMFLCLAACLLLGSYATYAMFKPVNNLLQYILPHGNSGVDEAKNEYEFFYQQYAKALKRGEHLEERFESIAPEVVRELMFRLISGPLLSEDYITETLESVHSDIKYRDRFIELAVQIQPPDNKPYQSAELSLLMKSLRNAAEEIPLNDGRMISLQMGENLFLLVFSFLRDTSVNKIKNTVLFFEQELNNRVKRLPYDITMGNGEIHNNLTDLHNGYNEALKDLKKISCRQNSGEESDDRALYRKQVENIVKVAAENREKAIGMVELMCDEAADRVNSTTEAQQAFELIIDCFLERLIAMHMSPQNSMITHARLQEEHLTGIDAMKDHTQAFCMESVHYLHSLSKKNSFKYMETAKAYIDDRFANSDLDLSSVAEYVGINVSYFSKLFGEMEGQTFVEYLSAYRVKKAKQMLDDTNLNVKEIGFMCGFNSPQNFIRVFKKYTGKTPGIYKGRK